MDKPNLVSMKRDKKEKQTELASNPSIEDDYGYGLNLYLGADELKKLGIKGLEAGQELTLCARVIVSSYTSSSSIRDGGGGDSANLQITDMALELPNKSDGAADTLYGK